jgi:methylated-DNA-protein-cysteine methyltransferase related protein
MTGERLWLQIKNLNDQGPTGKNLMSTTSTRAQAIADILWQLKKAEKLATLTSIAARAGFSPGANGRTVSTCLKTVRRDWPHLQWWRAVADNGQMDDEQKAFLAKAGFETETVDGGTVVIKSFATQLMSWDEPEEQANDDSVAASDGGRAVKAR